MTHTHTHTEHIEEYQNSRSVTQNKTITKISVYDIYEHAQDKSKNYLLAAQLDTFAVCLCAENVRRSGAKSNYYQLLRILLLIISRFFFQ